VVVSVAPYISSFLAKMSASSSIKLPDTKMIYKVLKIPDENATTELRRNLV
jgi:hypothetical protein